MVYYTAIPTQPLVLRQTVNIPTILWFILPCSRRPNWDYKDHQSDTPSGHKNKGVKKGRYPTFGLADTIVVEKYIDIATKGLSRVIQQVHCAHISVRLIRTQSALKAALNTIRFEGKESPKSRRASQTSFHNSL
ncbi:hypothetical protein CVT25_006325 [Psilocybe cyanescens]|uniref:Uncharacterized protein n=1 Tax=Psilocybe cyanescens TaxID=93625 RepID=A0A409X3U3_PSICY|nr:hypothetical protein CVT25_006325 [Psilocybe cyanescens]